jgi:hypothetical protein
MPNTLDTTGGDHVDSWGWRGLDVAVVSLALAALDVVEMFVPPSVLGDSVASGVYGVAFGPVTIALTLWIYVRLWAWIHADGATSHFVVWALVAYVAYAAYSNLWPLLFYGHTITPALDVLAFGVRIAGVVLLGAAMASWSALPRWVGSFFLAYAFYLLVRFAVERTFGLVLPPQLNVVLWSACLVGLGIGVLQSTRVARVSEDSNATA